MAQKLKFLILLFLLLSWSSIAQAYDWTQDANCEMALLMEIDEDPLSDSSGNGNTAALLSAGSPNYATASPPDTYSVGYYDYDGDDDKAEVADSAGLDFAAAFSFTIWIVQDSAGLGFHRYSGDGYYLNGGTDWQFSVFVDGGEDFVVSNDAPSGGWDHVVGVRQADGTLIMYVDGVLQSDSGSKAGAIDVAADLHLGEHTNGAGNLDGQEDEFALFSDEIVLSEVNDIFDNGLAGAVSARRMFIVS